MHQAEKTKGRWPAAGLLLAVALLAEACTTRDLEPRTSPGAPAHVSRSQEALGETTGGYPSDQERMLLVLVNQARHSAKTPNTNECGDWTTEVGAAVKKVPLVYSREANLGARFTSRHLSEVGCYQHDNCCQLGDAGAGLVGCLAPGACNGSGCNRTCDAGVGQADDDRYRLLGFQSYAGESLAQAVQGAYEAWCGWMMSQSNRQGLYADAVTQAAAGLHNGTGTCGGAYWTLAYGNAQVTVPRIPAASAMHAPPNPLNTAQLHFAANYYDATGKAPQRAEVVVNGHCFDLERKWGFDDNGTYEARFPDPDLLPDGCHPYYFLFVDGDGNRHTYPTAGSLQVALGQSQSCPLAYDPSAQLPADCETGQQACPAGGRQACYTQDNQTLRFGECRQGTQVCRTGFWSACRDMIGPFPDVCDGLDNDCDGEVDEGDPGGGASCQVFGERGLCVAGARHCVSGRLTCVGTASPQTEVCNGLDDDCDGEVDDGFGLQTCGQGECFRIAPSCVNGQPQGCVPGTTDAGELDDGKDNDCNGAVDDGVFCINPDAGVPAGYFRQIYPVSTRLPDGGQAQLVQPCKSGLQQCQADGGWGPVAGAVVPSTEVCNGQDDDCDGQFDNSVPAQLAMGWQRCGVGACTVFTSSCTGSTPLTCTPRAPGVETCNGQDDDCNGVVDDGCDCRLGDERPCYSGPSETRGVGVCVPGKRSCVDGGYTKCQGEVKPSQELCNGADDDCDGEVDDLCVGGADGGDADGGEGGGAGGGGGSGAGPSGCGCAGAGGGAWAILGVLALWRRRRCVARRAPSPGESGRA